MVFNECVGSTMIIFMTMLLNLGDFMSTLQHACMNNIKQRPTGAWPYKPAMASIAIYSNSIKQCTLSQII